MPIAAQNDKLSSHGLICEGCWDDLPFRQEVITIAPVIQLNLTEVTPKPFEVYALLDYQWPVDRWLHVLKYQARFEILPILNSILQDTVNPFIVDAVVAVPMSDQRLRERGFNHAAQLATLLSQHWQIPIWNGVRRVKHTQKQQSLNRTARLHNLKDAFACVAAPPLRVLVVDDVLTTGSTLLTLRATLLQAGAVQVYGFTFASAHWRAIEPV